MIVSFSVSNFLSFAGEETLTLVASTELGASHQDHTLPIPGSESAVLRVGVLYGANGSGKSNLFRALRFLRQLATETRPKGEGTGCLPFRFTTGSSALCSFDLQFVAGTNTYRFGCRLNASHVVEEWLTREADSGESVVFERTTSADGRVYVALDGSISEERIVALSKVGGPPNQSFLATVSANLDSAGLPPDFAAPLSFFANLGLIAPDEVLLVLATALLEDPPLRDFASRFLAACSTGVRDLQVSQQELSEEQVRQHLSPHSHQHLTTGPIRLSDGSQLIRTGDHYQLHTIRAAHETSAATNTLALAEESDGTRRLLDLLPTLYQLQKSGGTLFVDEIDRSMHPHLVRQILSFVLEDCRGPGRQLIVTTHESNLLDLNLLRRDEIWFVEKDKEGATHLYSLLDFPIRKDQDIRRHYFEGRFGAVPFLGRFQYLLTESEVDQ